MALKYCETVIWATPETAYETHILKLVVCITSNSDFLKNTVSEDGLVLGQISADWKYSSKDWHSFCPFRRNTQGSMGNREDFSTITEHRHSETANGSGSSSQR